MTKTQNYNLNKPEASDPIRVADFNQNSDIIDAALAGCAKIATGSYVGTGTYGSTNKNSLAFEFEPKLIFLFRTDYYGPFANTKYTGGCCGTANQIFYYGGSAFGVFDSTYDTVHYTLNGNGLTWYTNLSAAAQMNAENTTYSYLAIG